MATFIDLAQGQLVLPSQVVSTATSWRLSVKFRHNGTAGQGIKFIRRSTDSFFISLTATPSVSEAGTPQDQYVVRTQGGGGSSGLRYNNPPALLDGQFHIIDFYSNGTTLFIDRDGVNFSSSPFTAVFSGWNQLTHLVGPASLEHIKFYESSDTSVPRHSWDVSSANDTNTGAQPIIIESVSGFNATGSGFPTDGSAFGSTADTTAPTFSTAPVVTATSTTGLTIASTLNETGTVYGVRLASGATAPSPAQVKAGQDSTGAAALESVLVAATASVSANLVFSTGSPSTAYDYYIVAEDDEATPNIQATPTSFSATTPATAVPGIGQLTVQFEGVSINVADWHIITRLAADQSILYNQTGQSSDASGNIAAFATVSGSVGDPVRVEGLSAADAYSFVIEQNLGNIA
jgi:hypothetical protein